MDKDTDCMKPSSGLKRLENFGESLTHPQVYSLESPLDCKEIQPVHSERDQPWDFFGKNDATAEIPVLWPPHEKS